MGGTSTPSMNTATQPLGDVVGAVGAITQGALNGVTRTVMKPDGQMGGRMFRFMSRRKQRKMMRKSRKSHKKKTLRRR
jgi:hypothetical protein